MCKIKMWAFCGQNGNFPSEKDLLGPTVGSTDIGQSKKILTVQIGVSTHG
jgi:hypothetical protein